MATLLACTGCGSSGAAGYADGGAPRDSAPVDVAEGSVTVGDGPTLGGEGGNPDASTGPAVVYAHSLDTLYKLDPTTKAVTVVGPFAGCSQAVEIALDKDSNMYATTLDGFYKIDTTTAACTLIHSAPNYPNSLSFVPAGTLDPSVEALVGYVGDQYVRIDPMTGAMTNVGTAIGQSYSSSGDIVSAKGGGTYLTVKGGPNNCSDCLIQVDPKTGAFLMEWGPVNHTDVFGIAFWAGAVYGFDVAGDVFEIDFSGLALQLTAIPVPNAPPGLSFQGAGSTTIAPINPNK